ncbi:MAG: hypothetical protein H4O13_13615 [Xanthomonadales bacterium]|nr:hypothetical protein [Xanthomonadales bacterium]
MISFFRVSAALAFAASNWLGVAACHAAGLEAAAKPAQLDHGQWASLQRAVDANLQSLVQFEGDAATVGADGAPEDEFSFSVAFDGDTALIGAPRDDVGNAVDQGSVHVFKRVGENWQYETKLVAQDGESTDLFGYSVDLDGDTAIIGGLFRGPDGSNRIAVAYVFVRSGGAWVQQQRLTTSYIHAFDRYETSVAVSGDIALVGVRHETVGTAVEQGAAYVFVRVGSSWSQQGPMLVAADGGRGSRFGASVDLVGTTALIGAWTHQVAENFDQGAAYVFVQSGGGWIQQARLTASNGADYDFFGFSVALDGDAALVGAPNHRVSGSVARGAAYVFRRSGTSWSEEARLLGFGGEAAARFGHSVALDAGIAAVGAPTTSAFAGRAYVFARTGSTWSQQVSYSAPPPVEFQSALGTSVALSGGSLLMGAPGRDVEGNSKQGAAFFAPSAVAGAAVPEQIAVRRSGDIKGFGYRVDTHDGTAVVSASTSSGGPQANPAAAYVFAYEDKQWILQARLESPDPSMGDSFGASVAIFGDLALVGAPHAAVGGVAGRGAVYAYRRSGSTWGLEATLTSEDGEFLDGFGAALGLHGQSAVVGAFGHRIGGNPDQGAAYVFVRDGQRWSLQGKLTASDGAAQDRFGLSVSIYGDRVLIGATDAINAGGLYRGVAYVFERVGSAWSQSARLTPDLERQGGGFGLAVDLDADTAVIGGASERAQPQPANAVYVFSRAGSSWSRQARLESGQSFFDAFGASVAVSRNSLLVAAPESDLVYLFTREQGVWSLERALTDNVARSGDRFGNSVAASGGFALIGAPGSGGTLPFGNPQDGGAYVLSGLAELFSNGFESPARATSARGNSDSP